MILLYLIFLLVIFFLGILIKVKFMDVLLEKYYGILLFITIMYILISY